MTDKKSVFAEIAEMAAEERRIHPGHLHFQQVDTALGTLRANIEAYNGAAATAASLGNHAEAEHMRAQAAITLTQALPVWAARLEAARAEQERVRQVHLRAQRESRSTMMGVYPPGRGADVMAAWRVLELRVGALVCNLSRGDEVAFNGSLDEMEGALATFRSSIGNARRDSRLRVAAARADAAVSAVSAEAA